MLSVYHSGAAVSNQSKITGSNVYSSTYSGIKGGAGESQFLLKTGGNTIQRMNKEELELRKKGQTPTKQFLDEKKKAWQI